MVENERWQYGSPELETLRRVTSMARVAMPEAISIQMSPNLAPARDLLDCGVDDLGGVSPVTVDHINPEYEWPALRELEHIAEIAGVPLRERLPVYERFVADGWLSDPIECAIATDDEHGERYRSHLDSVSKAAMPVPD